MIRFCLGVALVASLVCGSYAMSVGQPGLSPASAFCPCTVCTCDDCDGNCELTQVAKPAKGCCTAVSPESAETARPALVDAGCGCTVCECPACDGEHCSCEECDCVDCGCAG